MPDDPRTVEVLRVLREMEPGWHRVKDITRRTVVRHHIFLGMTWPLPRDAVRRRLVKLVNDGRVKRTNFARGGRPQWRYRLRDAWTEADREESERIRAGAWHA